MNTKDFGDIGEAIAIAELTKLGYKVSVPISENNSYDLIAEDKEGLLLKIQVKACNYIPKDCDYYQVGIRSVYLDSTGVKQKHFDKTKVDYLFIHLPIGNYLIPSKILPKSTVTITKNGKYDKYIIGE